MDYCDFMLAVYHLPFKYDRSKCEHCFGLGLNPVMCCNGHMCGCRGEPTDYVDCEYCDAEPPTEEVLENSLEGFKRKQHEESDCFTTDP